MLRLLDTELLKFRFERLLKARFLCNQHKKPETSILALGENCPKNDGTLV